MSAASVIVIWELGVPSPWAVLGGFVLALLFDIVPGPGAHLVAGPRYPAAPRAGADNRSPANPTAVGRALGVAFEALGIAPNLVFSNGGLDANWLTAHGLPTVTMGCGQNGIHTVKESLFVPDYLAACRVAVRLATGA